MFVLAQVSWEKYKRALKLCCFNTTVVGFTFNVVTAPLLEWRGCEVGYQLPSFATTLWHLFCYMIIEEIGFYYGHRSVLVAPFLGMWKDSHGSDY